jgi:hypothetical protein
MKKPIILFLAGILFFLTACRKNPCDGVVTYQKLDTRLTGYIFKPGSYWVYYDSIDGIRDSQYVFSYSYRIHYRDPIDTPQRFYYTAYPSGASSDTYCGPYYKDSLSMAYISYQNGLLIDTMQLFYYTATLTLNDNLLFFHENFFPSSLNFLPVFDLNPPDSIGLQYTESDIPGLPQADTTKFWYRGSLPSLSTSTAIFNTISVFGVQLIDQNSTKFKYPTDLYFSSGAGIVKMVQHRPSGDVPWILVNYHISN